MAKIVIESFQGWLANDRNQGQKWAFWNSKNIDYRRNSSFITLNKWSTDIITLPVSSWTPTCIQLWKNWWSFTSDIIVFTTTKIISSAWVDYTFSSLVPVNTIEANTIKYIIWQSSLGTYTSSSWAVNESVVSFWSSTPTRPAINFYWDLIIWNWTSVCRYNKDWTLITWTSGTTEPVIWWLQWTVMAITNIWPYIYVWCNDTANTILYLWDWVSSSPNQVIKYNDTPVRNLALLWNQHYWWALKGNYSSWQSSIRSVHVWESYAPQTICKSDFPDYPLLTNKDSDNNRMAFYWNAYWFVNDIESIWDIVYIPWYWSIFWIWKYLPWDKISLNREFSISWDYVQAMLSSGLSYTWVDCSWILYYVYNNWTGWTQPWTLAYINTWIKTATQTPTYQSSWFIESMEYIALDFADGEDDKKIIVPFELPHTSCSIKIYDKKDRASSYTLIKELTYSSYTWYNVAEIQIQWKWRTKQIKFELITTDTAYSPKLYTWITNISVTAWNKNW